MERHICPIIQKKICPHKNVESFYADERCTDCTIPEVYMGIRPNVPETNTQMVATGGIPKDMTVEQEMNDLYKFMLENSKVFQNMGMDQRGELMETIKKVLDKQRKF
jgi:hypothetical protein